VPGSPSADSVQVAARVQNHSDTAGNGTNQLAYTWSSQWHDAQRRADERRTKGIATCRTT